MSAIIFNENSPLLPVTRQKVDKLRETLINDKLTPWRWFNFRIVDITDFYGKTIYLGGKGTFYGLGTEVLVFFSFIKPFLEDAIVKIFDETIETCRVRGLKPVEPYIREAAMLLEGHLIYPIYDEIVDIDQHLRGKGNPKSVGRRNVVEESAEMRKILDERKDEMIRGINEQNERSVKALASTKQLETGQKDIPKKGEEREDLIVPKPPEFLQKLLWLWKYGRKHWILILFAAILLLFYILIQLIF